MHDSQNSPRAMKIPVGVLGATGTVGQRFVERLAEHPWFEITALAASERSASRPYGEAARWRLTTPLPTRLADMEVAHVADELPCRVVFSALDAATAREVEPLLRAGERSSSRTLPRTGWTTTFRC